MVKATSSSSQTTSRAAGFIGVLMLDTEFARPLGDIGNRNSFGGFPVRFSRIKGAYAGSVVRPGVPESGYPTLFPHFLRAAKQLEAQGARVITTSCGFLTPLQARLRAELSVPVAVSSLLQVPWLNQSLPLGKNCAVLTIDAKALSPSLLSDVGIAATTAILGMPVNGAFQRMIFETDAMRDRSLGGSKSKEPRGYRDAIEAEITEVLRTLPDNTGALVLECTNLSPYRHSIQRITGLPVYDIHSLLTWVTHGFGSGHLLGQLT